VAEVTVHMGGSGSPLAGIDVDSGPSLRWFRRKARHQAEHRLLATLTLPPSEAPTAVIPVLPTPLDRSENEFAINLRGWIELPPKGRQ
jgi:hypothetical protein